MECQLLCAQIASCCMINAVERVENIAQHLTADHPTNEELLLILVKLDHILLRECFLVLPLMLSSCPASVLCDFQSVLKEPVTVANYGY